MIDREKVIAKLEKEVKKTYLIKTTTYNNGKKVNEEITEHRESGIRMSMEMADKILALLKEQEDLGTELTNAMELIHKKNERIKKLEEQIETLTRWRMNAGAFD